jgi:hypothetical protein
MTTNKTQEGKCALCGNFGKLSFEHVPPRSAFNNKPIFIQNHDNLVNENSYLFGKKMKSNKGLGAYTLCQSCNNLTGDWYARDFVSFAQQGMAIISTMEPQPFIVGQYKFKPLNVIKQILTMFMSADKSGYLQSISDLTDFILNKESNLFPNTFKVFLYSNISVQKRMMGYSVVYDPVQGVQKWSEINFKPFGYLLSENSSSAHEDMLDITPFGQFRYDEEITMKMTTRYLNVTSPFIGVYD